MKRAVEFVRRFRERMTEEVVACIRTGARC